MSRVARYHADRTNQKLYFARLAIKEASQTEAMQVQQAHIEAALSHLYGALVAYYQELSRYYKLNLHQPNLDAIKHAMSLRTQQSPELMRIEQLINNGFIGDFLKVYDMSLYAPEPAEPSYEKNNAGLIVSVPQKVVYWLPEVKQLKDWHQQLVALIDGFREMMVEF